MAILVFCLLAVCAAVADGACQESWSPSKRQSEYSRLFDAAVKSQTGNRLDEAIETYKEALTCVKESPDAYHNMALAAHALGRLNDAVQAMHTAVVLKPNYPEAHFNLAVWLSGGNLEAAEKHFKQAILYKPDLSLAHTNLGVVLHKQGKTREALQYYEKSLELQPGAAENYFNMGKAYQEIGDEDSIHKAIKMFQTAVKVRPTYFEAYATLGGAFTPLRQWKESAQILRHALKLNPSSAEGVYLLAYSLMQLCAWEELNGVMNQLRELVRIRLQTGQRPGVEPYAALTFPWTNKELKDIAEFHSAEAMEQAAAQRVHFTFNKAFQEKGMRVGFKSFDIGDHQSSYLIVEAIKKLAAYSDVIFHVYCLRGNDGSSLRTSFQKIAGSRWNDVSTFPTADIAKKINADRIQILIDMDAHFRNSRITLLAMRSAPVQLNYPMFVGSAGASFLPMMFSDRIATPPEFSRDFVERFIYLPDSYYTNSHSELKILGSKVPPSRSSSYESEGLPTNVPIVSNFNQYYKLDFKTFDSWMTILNRINGSVLWLKKDSTQVENVLVKYARKAGIKRERIVFAKWAATSEDHLMRASLADLSLDMPMYNSMTTACDLVWAGVPMLVLPQEKMVSRLSSSLLLAHGSPELVSRSQDDYTDIALRLLQHGSKLARLREKVERLRKEGALFNMDKKSEQLHRGIRLAWDLFVSRGYITEDERKWSSNIVLAKKE